MSSSNPLPPGTIEHELGVPIPGAILPPERWAKTALKKLPLPGPIDFTGLFGQAGPLILDLGCGNGRFTLASAVRRPECNHLGLDALPVVIRYATRRANQRGLTNVRFAVGNACEFLETSVADGAATEIHVYHPQPYHETEQRTRRLISPEFLGQVHRALLPEGLFILQTDNVAYWRYICQVSPSLFDFHVQEGPWPDDPTGRSRREIVALSQGLPIFRGWGRPRADLDGKARQETITALPLPLFDARSNPGGGSRSRAGSRTRRKPRW